MYLQRCKGLFGSSFLLPFFVLVFLFFIFISNFFLSLIFRLFNVALRDALAISCSVYTYLRSDFFVCQSAKVYFYLSTAALKCEIHIFVLVYTQTQMAVACWKGFVVCHLFRIAIRFLSISFRSITIPFDLVDITNLLLTGHIIFSSRFVLQQFYYSRYDFYFLHIESENSMVCCVVSFLSFIFLLFFWSGLWSWIVSVHCGHRFLSIYIPGYLVVYECVCLCSFISAAQQKLCSVRLIHSIFYST